MTGNRDLSKLDFLSAEARALLATLLSVGEADKLDLPHVVIAYDTDPIMGLTAAIGEVVGPFPDKLSAMNHAEAWCADLNKTRDPEDPNDHRWTPIVVPIYPPEDAEG